MRGSKEDAPGPENREELTRFSDNYSFLILQSPLQIPVPGEEKEPGEEEVSGEEIKVQGEKGRQWRRRG